MGGAFYHVMAKKHKECINDFLIHLYSERPGPFIIVWRSRSQSARLSNDRGFFYVQSLMGFM